MFGSIRGAVATGKAAAKGGSSHPCERPTSIDEQPNLCTISVAADSKDSTRGLALASPIVFFVGDREISRKDMSHVCEKKGVKKPKLQSAAPQTPKITPLPTAKLGHYCCARDAHPTCSVCSDRCVGTHTHLKSQDSPPRALEERNPTSYGRCHQSSSSCRMGGSLLAAAYLLGKMPEQHRCVWTELPGRDGLGSGGGQHARLLLTFGWLRARWIECES
jgi:hypothetical protein